MSSVLDRSALSESPLADLHLLANELGVDGFRRLRKDDLIDAILTKQAGDDLARPEGGDAGGGDDDEEAPTRSRRGRRGGRTRPRRDEDNGDDAAEDEKPARGGRGRSGAKVAEKEEKPAEDKEIEGVVELLGNGSAFVRLTEGETSDEDVYVSAAQVKRCELVSGDKISGPMRPPRRSERFPSLVRVDTINGKPADEVSEGTRFDDLPVVFPAERLELGSEDPTVKAIEWLTPFGKGSRVTVIGPARAGKSEALRRIAAALAEKGGVELTVVLAGVRPEEVAEWQSGPTAPAAAVTFAASADSQGQAVEHAVEQGRRVAARGADAVVIVDSLEYLAPAVARRALAAARNIADGGSLTVIASSPAPLGGETTVIALDAALTAMGRFPALDLASSGTMRPELLVGDAGAEAIAKARADTAAA
jgi:transcription termination factor Rho